MVSRSFSSTECSTWNAVFLTITVAVVIVNLISIIIFVKNSYLRTRSMYLVINLTVADMFVGGIATFFVVFHFLLYGCEVGSKFRFRSEQILVALEWQYFLVLVMIDVWIPLTSVTGIAVISLDRMHATFRLIQASQHQKMGLRGNNCGRLDFNCDDSNSLSVNTSLWELATTVAIAFSFLLMAVILLPLPCCYLCFVHLHCFKILVWNPSSFPWCSQ